MSAGRRLKRRLSNLRRRWTLRAGSFPPEVWLENTNICNARCIMCPRDTHTRAQGVMALPLFEKIIREIGAHRDSVARLHLHNYGEPLVDQDLALRIRLAKAQGIRHVYFVTNASLLTEPRSRELIAAGLDEFKISFYGTDPKTYNQTMAGLDFETTLANVRTFFRLRREAGARAPKVVIQYLPQAGNEARVDEFAAMFESLIDRSLGDAINIFALHNFGGSRGRADGPRLPRRICDYPWRTMVVLHDGRVVPCCLDYNGRMVLGNANSQTLAEIWNGPAYADLRARFRACDYKAHPICLGCDHIL